MKDTQNKLSDFDREIQNIDIKVNQLIEKDLDVKIKKMEEENEIKIVSFQL